MIKTKAIPGPACVKTMTVFRTVVTKLRNPKTVSVTRGEAEETVRETGDSDVTGVIKEIDDGSLRGI